MKLEVSFAKEESAGSAVSAEPAVPKPMVRQGFTRSQYRLLASSLGGRSIQNERAFEHKTNT